MHLERLEERALPSFVAALSYDVGSAPVSVAVADLNRDGTPDLAVANAFSSNVSVLLGSGNGAFQPARNFAVGSSPQSVAVGDFNGDGLPDLAVANNSGSLDVLLGNGDGTFQAPRPLLGGGSVTVADINRDDRLDLVTPFSVFLGNGDGTFQAPRPFDAGTDGRSVAVGDVNGDGRPDLAVAGSDPKGGGGETAVLLGNGDGTFQTARLLDVGGASVAMADVNTDRRLDLAVTNFGTVSVLVGNGDGTFQPARNFNAGSQPDSVAVADVNSDSRPDLIVANLGDVFSRTPGSVSVLLGNGDGSFQGARNFYGGSEPRSLAVADVNADGRLDLAVTNRTTNTVSVLLGNGDGSFLSAPRFPSGGSPLGVHSVAAGEFNGDGRPDLAAANYDTHTVGVRLSNGDGTFQALRTFAAGRLPISLRVGDFNGDGRSDLAVANAGSNQASVLLGNGDGSFQAPRSVPAGFPPNSLAVGEFNGDGLLDVAVANDSSVNVLLGNGDGTFQAPRSFPAGFNPRSVMVGDFNRDGWLDLAVVNVVFDNGNVSVVLGNGDGTFQAPRTSFAGRLPHSLAVGDFDGDGRLDVAVAGDSIRVLLGDGDGFFQDPRRVAGAGGSLAVADFNGDGRPDLAFTNGQPDIGFPKAVKVLLGNGDGSFQATHVSYVAGEGLIAMAVQDFDGDGWPDLAVADWQSNDVSILVNAADDAAFFFLDAPATVPTGQPFDLTVYALSADWQRLAHGYRGTVAFWSSDKAATLPEPYTFRPEDWGIASFPGGVTLRTPGLQELYAFDLETFTVFGYAVVDVLGTAPGGGGGARFGSADFALAHVGLDLATWTRTRRSVWAPAASLLP